MAAPAEKETKPKATPPKPAVGEVETAAIERAIETATELKARYPGLDDDALVKVTLHEVPADEGALRTSLQAARVIARPAPPPSDRPARRSRRRDEAQEAFEKHVFSRIEDHEVRISTLERPRRKADEER